jgi:pyruvate ferredoxin oxidoreductase gamma subunit
MQTQQVRVHGRGGQGVVTAAEIIALAAFESGRQAQAFPSFGVERTGAPIQAYARLSEKPILIREQVQKPDIVIVQDASLLSLPEILAGTDPRTKFIINSPKSPLELSKDFGSTKNAPKAGQISTVDATGIALKILKKNITNTVILGTFARATGLISLADLKTAVALKFSGKDEALIKNNQEAVTMAYNI